MTDSNLIEQAKLGDPQAIETLMNQSLQSRGMRAVVERQGDSLEVVLEAERVPNRQALTAFVQKGINNLDIQSIRSIRILGQQVGASYPAWMQELQLEASLTDAAPLNIQPETAADITRENLDTLPPAEVESLPHVSSEIVPEVEPAGQSINELGTLWAEQSTEETPDFLNELLTEDSVPATELADEPTDEGLLDFLNELSGTPASETYPPETAQELSAFDEELAHSPTDAEFQDLFAESPEVSAASMPSSSDTWMDTSETSAGEPDADLLDFLNEAAPDAQTLDLTEPSDLSNVESMPQNDTDSSRFDLPTEDLLSTFMSESSDPIPAPDMPPASLDSLDSQIDDLFAAEPDNADELFTEEVWPEQPPESDEDLLQALISEPPSSSSTDTTDPAADDLGLNTVRDPWMEGTEDVVLGIPEQNQFQSVEAADTQPMQEPLPELELPETSPEPLPDLVDISAAEPFGERTEPEPPNFEQQPTAFEPDRFVASELPESGDVESLEPLFVESDLPESEPAEPWQPWQPWRNTDMPESGTPEADPPNLNTPTETDSNLSATDFSLDPTPDSPEQPANLISNLSPSAADFTWPDDVSEADVEVEEIPPDFLLDFQDDESMLEFSNFVEAPLPESANQFSAQPASVEPIDERTEPLPEPEPSAERSLSDLPFLADELAALNLTDSHAELAELDAALDAESNPSDDFDDFAALTLDQLDQPDAELAELLSETPEGTAVEPPEHWLTDVSQPAEFPEELLREPPAPASTTDLTDLEASVASPEAASPEVSQDALEAGLGDFREGFVEPLPSEFLDDEANQSTIPDWQADLREPLNLDVDDSEADYIIEDSTPADEYTPPPLPPQPGTAQPQRTAESQSPAWLFPLVLVLVCGLFAALGFSVFWSKVRSPNPPATEPTEPPAEPTAPASPTSANPVSPVANSPVNSPTNALKLALERGSTAVTLSQAAQSVDDWNLVASKWQQAIDLLKGVPASSPDHAAARQKLAEYQSYLTVAQQRAKQPIVAAAPLGAANIRTPAAAQAAVSCSPIASTPNSQPIELSKVQFDPTAEPAEASSIVGCITNHTEQAIAAVDVAYKSSLAENDSGEAETTEASGKLNFSKLDPKQTVPFKSAFTIAPAAKDVTIASISWTAAGTSEAQQLPASVSLTRPEKQEG